jgi:glycosyltransferase involved in cell wall biosynthesis
MKIRNFFKDMFNSTPKTVVSLTTIPTRLISEYGYDIKYCLESLLNQTYDDYEIHFNIPFVFKKTNEEYVIPEWLEKMEQENKKLKIFRTDDYGAITKSLPTILRITNPETIIIVVDDDLVYHEELISEHVKNQTKWQNNPVGYDGMRSRNDDGTFSSHFNDSRDYFYSATYRNSKVDILQHYKSVSYKRRFFEEDFEKFVTGIKHWNDDLLISTYFASKKIDRIVTYYEKDKNCETEEEWRNHVGISFPILRHTQHRTDEGCNIERAKNDADEATIFNYLDKCYNR